MAYQLPAGVAFDVIRHALAGVAAMAPWLGTTANTIATTKEAAPTLRLNTEKLGTGRLSLDNHLRIATPHHPPRFLNTTTIRRSLASLHLGS